MLLTLYPNGELRARVAASPRRRVRKKDVKLVRLDNRAKLAILPDVPAEFFQYPSCPWPRPGYGGIPKRTPFSVRGRRLIARTGGVFAPAEEGRLCFFTGTLPGSTDSSKNVIALYSSWIVHQLLTRIPRSVGCKPSQCLYQWVWEFQERGALHWHCVMQFPDRESAQAALAGFKTLWVATLRGVQKKSNVDIAARSYGGTWANDISVWKADARLAFASPSQYLSKYISKDGSKIGSGDDLYPTRWYGLSREILSLAKVETVTTSTCQQKGDVDYRLTPDDLDLLERLHSISDRAISFVDKVRDGCTFVFYPGAQYLGQVQRLLEGFTVMNENIVTVRSDVVYRCRFGPMRVSFKFIERVTEDPALLERLYNDITLKDQSYLDDYIEGRNFPFLEVAGIDMYARNLLSAIGVIRSVKAPKEAQRALTGGAVKTLESEGRAGQMELYPGFPF